MTSSGQVLYAGGNECVLMIKSCNPYERDSLYNFVSELAPGNAKQVALLGLLEGLYSQDLTATIPRDQDIRVSDNEAILDISRLLSQQTNDSKTIEQSVEAIYKPIYEKFYESGEVQTKCDRAVKALHMAKIILAQGKGKGGKLPIAELDNLMLEQ